MQILLPLMRQRVKLMANSSNRLFNIFSNLMGRTPLHPQYFSKSFLSRQVKQEAASITGITADLGSGFSPYKKHFKAARYLCLDFLIPQNIGSRNGPDMIGDLLNLPLASASADAVLCTQVLEHVYDPRRAMAEISRVLKPGGRLILSVPFFYPMHDEPNDYFRFSKHGLFSLLVNSGFTKIDVRPQGGFISMSGEFLNLFMVHKIYNLLNAGGIKKVLGWVLAPLVLILSLLINLVCLAVSPLDKERRFTMNYFVTARRQ